MKPPICFRKNVDMLPFHNLGFSLAAVVSSEEAGEMLGQIQRLVLEMTEVFRHAEQ